jgi:hypothetical protein
MQIRKVLGYGAMLAGLLMPVTASANQPQDWMLAAGKPGTYVNLDAVFGAFQAGLEHRINMFGNANQFTLRASAIAAIPFGSTQVDADLRILVLTLGTSVGAADVWHNQTFAATEDITRKQRREREASGQIDSMTYGFWEGRTTLSLPFNDYVLFNSPHAFRVTGARERSFDNGIGVVHDGNYYRGEFQLFFKHPDVGGIAPLVQLLNFPLDGSRHTQVNYGFIFLSRAGLVRRNDLILFQLLFHPGGELGGYDNRQVYGMAVLRGPVQFTLAYRSVINL